MKILVLNGPNLNLLGLREPSVYGSRNYAQLCALIEHAAHDMAIDIAIHQSNHEGALVDMIQEAYGAFDGIVINPAAYTHTSVALLDALKAVGLPTIEVHISDVSRREDFRKVSYVRAACIDTVSGLGLEGYVEALKKLKRHIGGGTS